MENFELQMKMLVELQGLDIQIMRLEDELNLIPEQIAEMDDSFREKTVKLKKAEDNLKTIQVKRKEKEGDLESKEGTIKKYQSQLYQVKTNKEYSALQEEIARARADNSLIEEDVIKLLDQIDNENKNIASEKEILKKAEATLSDDKKKLNEESDRIKKDLETLKAQRNELAVKIDKTFLAKYEKLRKNRDGIAVVTVANDACQGCFRVLPPQVINEIKMKTDLVFCDSCTRILYAEE